MQNYLKLPVQFVHFFEQKPLKTCSLRESIARNLHLLITTTVGENKQDSEYGALFWDYDYHIHMTNDARREVIITTIRKQVREYEKRLSDVSVDVNLKQTEYHIDGRIQIRKRIELFISGLMIRNNEHFSFQTAFFIGPLLLD